MAEFDYLQNLQGLLSFTPNEDEKKKAMQQGLLMAGLGILSQNAQNPRGAGFGGALSGALPGVQAYHQTLENAPKQRMQNVQGMLQIAQLKKALESQEMLKQFVGGGMGAPPQPGQALSAEQAAGGPAGPTTQAARPQPTAGQVPNFGALVAAGVPGETVKALMEHWKLQNPEMKVDNGYAFNPRAIQPGFMPGLNFSREGKAALAQIDPATGLPTISAPPGAGETFAGYEDISAKAQARYKPFERKATSPGGYPSVTSELDAATGFQRDNQQRVPSLQGRPQAEQDAINQVLNASAQGKHASVSVPPIPTSAVIPGNASGMPPAQVEQVKTDAERARGVNTATTEIGKDAVGRLAKEADAQRGIVNTLETVEKIIQAPQGVYGNSPMDRAAMLAHTQGLQSPKSINTQRIRELGSQLVLARGSLGSQVSNKDAEIYAKAAGDFQNAKSAADMIDSIRIMKEIAGKAMAQTNQSLQSFQTTGQIPPYAIPSTDSLIHGTRGTAPAAPMRRSTDRRGVVDFGSLK